MRKLTLLLLLIAGSCTIRAEFRRDTIQLSADSIIIIETACAPICSSIARVYNKEWKEVGRLQSPFDHPVFAEAYIEDDRILWRDNTPKEEPVE